MAVGDLAFYYSLYLWLRRSSHFMTSIISSYAVIWQKKVKGRVVSIANAIRGWTWRDIFRLISWKGYHIPRTELTIVVYRSATMWSGYSTYSVGKIKLSIFFNRLIWKMDELSPLFMVGYFNTSNVDFKVRCVLIEMKPHCTHCIHPPCCIHLLASWIGNSA